MDLKVGDKIRILVDRWNFAGVEAGDVLVVEEVEEGWDEELEEPYEVFSADGWWFGSEGEGIGWEKVEEDQ